MTWLTVHIGDNRDVLPTLPDASVHCVVTSPPYWGLRDYGNAGQLGLEATPEEYVENLVAVFREVRRVLRDDGTVWLNLGDSYAAGPMTTAEAAGIRSGSTLNGRRGHVDNVVSSQRRSNVPPGLKPKDLVGIPWRVAFALQADGWYLRSDIIWSKPNPMPESVTDRPTKSHEYLFLLTKSPRYYFDQEAVRQPLAPKSLTHRGGGKAAGKVGRQDALGKVASGNFGEWDKPRVANADGANIRSVWTIATQPYPGAHFAVFPPALVEPCIKAGTSERGVCGECGAPWERVVERGFVGQSNPFGPSQRIQGNRTALKGVEMAKRNATRAHDEHWRPSCDHDAPTVPATVLDPFGGSGTVGVVANKLSRRAIIIELNPDYGKQIEQRNRQAPLGI